MRSVLGALLLAMVLIPAPGAAQMQPQVSFNAGIAPAVRLPADGSEVFVAIPAVLACDQRQPMPETVFRIEGQALVSSPHVHGTVRPEVIDDLDCTIQTQRSFTLRATLRADPEAEGERSYTVTWALAARYSGAYVSGRIESTTIGHATVPLQAALAVPQTLHVPVRGDAQAFDLPIENAGNAPVLAAFDPGPVHAAAPASFADPPTTLVGLETTSIPLVFDAPAGAWSTRTVEMAFVPKSTRANETGAPVATTIVFENANVLEANVPALGGVLLLGLVGMGLVAWRQASKDGAD